MPRIMRISSRGNVSISYRCILLHNGLELLPKKEAIINYTAIYDNIATIVSRVGYVHRCITSRNRTWICIRVAVAPYYSKIRPRIDASTSYERTDRFRFVFSRASRSTSRPAPRAAYTRVAYVRTYKYGHSFASQNRLSHGNYERSTSSIFQRYLPNEMHAPRCLGILLLIASCSARDIPLRAGQLQCLATGHVPHIIRSHNIVFFIMQKRSMTMRRFFPKLTGTAEKHEV